MVVRLTNDFFQQDAHWVAPRLLGKIIVRRLDDGNEIRLKITETEIYYGQEDKACHASKGRTPRTEIMYAAGGKLYVYFIYGMYWLLNIVTGNEGHPQAVLIRGAEHFNGPGKVGRALHIDRSFYGEDIELSTRLWVEDHHFQPQYEMTTRVGIDYAGEEWISKPWRFVAK
ncbi:MAG: DNA-3-methyladenine glycosylase [Microbacter sp.]